MKCKHCQEPIVHDNYGWYHHNPKAPWPQPFDWLFCGNGTVAEPK